MLFIFTIGMMVFMILSMYGSVITSVPIVPVRDNALKYIIQNLKLTDTSCLYDLGSGDGKVLLAALKSTSHAQVRGYEIAPIPRLLSLFCLREYHHRTKIYNEDFFKADVSDATHVFLYLYPAVLQKLEPLFDVQLQKGTRVVTCDFTFPNKTPVSVFDIPDAKTLAKKLYVYIW